MASICKSLPQSHPRAACGRWAKPLPMYAWKSGFGTTGVKMRNKTIELTQAYILIKID